MNRKEELRYLTLLCLDASRRERSEGEVKSGLELEVEHRLNSLIDIDDGVDDRIVTGAPTEVNPVIHLDATEAVSGSPGKCGILRRTGHRQDGSKMKPDWDAFCAWIKEDMKLSKLPIEWIQYEKDDFRIIRIDLCKGKSYHVTTAIEDRSELCNHDVAYALARGLLPVLYKAMETNSPYTYINYFDIRAVV